MRHDELEQFIKDNRGEFDDAYPSLKLWVNIERQLDVPRTHRFTWRRFSQIAAAVLLLLGIGGVVGHQLATQSVVVASSSIAEIMPDFPELERYYNQQIDKNYARLSKLTSDPTLDADLAEIDQAMEDLKAELAVAPQGAEMQLVEDLIRNYQLKLQILERVLEQMRTTSPNVKKNKDNETSI